MSKTFSTGYMDAALFRLSDTLNEAVDDLAPHLHRFDTLVGTGFSGGVIIPALAMRLNKMYALVRKDSDDTHHAGPIMGEVGASWIFVDDFIGTGTTERRVVEQMEAVRDGTMAYWTTPHPTEWVGTYLYALSARDYRWSERP
jgi:orotate phosphoribosyltransferase